MIIATYCKECTEPCDIVEVKDTVTYDEFWGTEVTRDVFHEVSACCGEYCDYVPELTGVE
jgi:hypothetical protein